MREMSKLRRILINVAVLLVIATVVICLVLYYKSEDKSGEKYHNHHLIQFTPNSDEEVRKLVELKNRRDLLSWTRELRPGRPAIFQVPPDKLELVTMSIEVLRMPFVLLSSNVEEYLVNGKRPEFRLDRASDFDLNHYHNHTEIEKYLIKLADEQSERLSVATYGTSFESRQLYYVRIFRSIEEAAKNQTKAKKIVFIECGAHSREWLSPAVCLQIINSLVHHTESQPLLEKYEFYILPLINPDGYAYTWTKDRLWRKNRRRLTNNCTGVDLNRNFNIGFTSEIPGRDHFSSLDELDNYWDKTFSRPKRMAEDDSSEPIECRILYPGKRAFTENETLYLKRLMDGLTTKPSVYISLHARSQKWLYPFGFHMISPMDEKLEHYAKIGVEKVWEASGGKSPKWKYGRVIDIMYGAGGTSIDWAHWEVDIPLVYALEMRDANKFGFLLPEDQLEPAFREVWSGLSAVLLAYVEDTERKRAKFQKWFTNVNLMAFQARNNKDIK